jgi:hypothetical protein
MFVPSIGYAAGCGMQAIMSAIADIGNAALSPALVGAVLQAAIGLGDR